MRAKSKLKGKPVKKDEDRTFREMRILWLLGRKAWEERENG